MKALTEHAGLYVHIPFCRAKCPYCDFYSLPYGAEAADAYLSALCRAVYGAAAAYPGLSFDTVYFGGGTPSLFGAARIRDFLRAVRECFALAQGAEITVEANPASCSGKELSLLREAGANRISFGVQSGIESELRALGRLHSVRDAARSIEEARAAGFENISADLMLAVPGQTRESLRESVEFLSAQPVTHLSAYLLKIEEGTAFADKNTAASCPDEDEAAALYLACVELLAQQGFQQYEISNFARSGAVSRHNLKYWRLEPYLGLGPAAHSFLEGQRFFFPRYLAGFVEAEQPFSLRVPDGDGGGAEEYAMLRLRLTEGLDLGRVRRLYPAADADGILTRARTLPGLVEVRDSLIRLTPQGFLLSSSVTARLLYG